MRTIGAGGALVCRLVTRRIPRTVWVQCGLRRGFRWSDNYWNKPVYRGLIRSWALGPFWFAVMPPYESRSATVAR